MAIKSTFGYTILYVADVAKTVAFYTAAFGLETKLLHESGLYAEMETGTTVLAFAGNEMADMNEVSIRKNSLAATAAGIELVFVSDTPHEAYKQALDHGAVAVKAPVDKPWGQTVGYVKDINGCLCEIASPVHPAS